MISASLTKKIDLLPQEEYSMVEEYVNRVSEFVVKKQQDKAWKSIKNDLKNAEKSMEEYGTVSFDELKGRLGV